MTERDGARVASLGMYIIDTFRFLQDNGTPEDPPDRSIGDQIGGAGVYAMAGARAWLAPNRLRMVVHRGEDWKQAWQDKLETFMENSDRAESQRGPWRFRKRSGEPTTKAVNVYRGEHRGFEYLTPRLRVEPRDLLDEEDRHLPEVIHFVCSPDRAEVITRQAADLAAEGRGCLLSRGSTVPLLAWEPIPDSASPENLQGCVALFPRLTVFSPNHEEAARLLDMQLSKEQSAQRRDIERMAAAFLSTAGDRSLNPVICIRSGALGAYIKPPSVAGFWTPAYHPDAAKVVDVTGGGNGWLGGFCAGLAHACTTNTRDMILSDETLLMRAAYMASVSASYMIEQKGLPEVQSWQSSTGDTPAQRLQELQGRRRMHAQIS